MSLCTALIAGVGCMMIAGVLSIACYAATQNFDEYSITVSSPKRYPEWVVTIPQYACLAAGGLIFALFISFAEKEKPCSKKEIAIIKSFAPVMANICDCEGK